MPLTVSPTIEQERAERQRVREEAEASLRLEGMSVDSETAALFERYVQGELTLAQVGTAVDELNNRDFGPIRLPGHQRIKKSA